MNIKKVMVQLAMVIEEKDAEVFNMVIRDTKDNHKPGSIMLNNNVATLRFTQSERYETYTIKFMGEEVYKTSSLTNALDTVVHYAQEYADNKPYYNKMINSVKIL